MMNESVVPVVCTIIKLTLSITNGNHEAMHTTKQSFSIIYHATILSLLSYFVFAPVTSHMTWVYFQYS